MSEKDEHAAMGDAPAACAAPATCDAPAACDTPAACDAAAPDAPAERVGEGLCLVRRESGLALVSDDGLELTGDFSAMRKRLRPQNLAHELLIRAARVKGVAHPTVFDATAGLGEDSFLLASAGFSVTLCERDPVIWALLADALERAAADPRLADAASRMRLLRSDSVVELAALEQAPDVVFLDPMFPGRQKSALVKKKLQLLQRLERPCSDEAGLMRAALVAGPRKVVVKRPAKGPWLAGVRPSYSLSGKAVRYDCVVPASCGGFGPAEKDPRP